MVLRPKKVKQATSKVKDVSPQKDFWRRAVSNRAELLRAFEERRFAAIEGPSARMVLVQEIRQKWGNYKKYEYLAEIQKTITKVLRLFHESQIVLARKKLSSYSKARNLETDVLGRLVILPTKEYAKLDALFKTNGTAGLYWAGISFIDESTLSRIGVLGAAGHELSHLIEWAIDSHREREHREALPVARELFIESCLGEQQRRKAIATARETFEGNGNNKKYDIATNKGQKIFLHADEIRAAKGLEAAERFIQELSLIHELTISTIDQAYRKALGK